MPPTTRGPEGLYEHNTFDQYQRIAKDYKDLVNQDMRYVVIAGGITGRRTVGSQGLYSTSRWYKNNIVKGSDIGENWEIARLLFHGSIRPLEVKLSATQISDALRYSMDHVQGRQNDGNTSAQQHVANAVAPPEELNSAAPEHLGVNPGELEDYWNDQVVEADAAKSNDPQRRIEFLREQVQLSRGTESKRTVSAPPQRKQAGPKRTAPARDKDQKDDDIEEV